jgi:hypothetical protein
LVCQKGLVAIKISQNTDATILGFFVVEVKVCPRRTFQAGTIKQALLALVIKECAGVLSDPVNLARSHI